MDKEEPKNEPEKDGKMNLPKLKFSWKVNPLYDLVDEYTQGEQVGNWASKHTQSSRYQKFFTKNRINLVVSYILSILTILMGYSLLEKLFMDWGARVEIAFVGAVVAFLLFELYYDNYVNDAISNYLSGKRFSRELYPVAFVVVIISGITTYFGTEQFWENQQTILNDSKAFELYSIDSVKTKLNSGKNYKSSQEINAYYDQKIKNIKDNDANWTMYRGKYIMFDNVRKEIRDIQQMQKQELEQNAKKEQAHQEYIRKEVAKYEAKNEAYDQRKRNSQSADIQESNAIFGILAIVFEVLKFMSRYKVNSFEVACVDEGIKMGLIKEPDHKAPTQKIMVERIRQEKLERNAEIQKVEEAKVVEYLEKKNDLPASDV